MGGTLYFVLRQGGGWIFVTSLHLTTKKRPCLDYHNLQQDIARQWRSRAGAHWDTCPSNQRQCPPVQVSLRIISALLIANRALNSLEMGLNTFMSFDVPSRDMCGWSMHCACVVYNGTCMMIELYTLDGKVCMVVRNCLWSNG